MKIYKSVLFIFLIAFALKVQSQDKIIFKEINKQVWQKFTKAFETSDHILFASIHTNDMIRINGNNKSLRLKDEYLNRYKRHFQNITTKETISFRFLERICNESLASERGIYKFTANLGNENEKSYYGKFHVLLRNENGVWKIFMDYDSSEGNTINEETYKKAFALDDYSAY